MKPGVGRNNGGYFPSGYSATASCSSSHSRYSSYDPVLTASSSSAGTRLPTSVEKRKSSTARLHLSFARRSPIFYRSFRLPVSIFTSAHTTFCSAFDSEHILKTCS